MSSLRTVTGRSIKDLGEAILQIAKKVRLAALNLPSSERL
jgi:hypothetical protein